MINIDYLTIKNFVEKNIDFLIGARVQKIQQPTRKDFIFSLRNLGESRKLYININPQIYHIAFASEENLKKRGITIPKTPPMFCMLLRKYLEGAKITDTSAVENERIIELHFDITDEFSEKRSLCLAIELMGKHSNIILYDRKTSIIIGCAHNIGSEKSRYRELQGGLKYIYPPKGNNISIISTPNFKQEELDTYFAQIQGEVNLKSEKTKLSGIVQTRLKKTKNSISKIETLLKKRDNTKKYKLYGELLTANLHNKDSYGKTIKVYNYYDNKEIQIELDETKSLKENAQRYYKLYTKSKTTKEKSEQMLSELYIEREYQENILYSLDKAESLDDISEIKNELEIVEQKAKKQEKPVVERVCISDFYVYIGKNNKQNDYIVSKLADDEDIWFHTRQCAGSHILLKTNSREPSEQVLYECCKLARKYSSAAQPSKVGVIYTKAKYLRKPPAAPLGYVTYKNEKEVLV